MKPTRRDAIAALAGVRFVAGSGTAPFSRVPLESATDSASALPSFDASRDTRADLVHEMGIHAAEAQPDGIESYQREPR